MKSVSFFLFIRTDNQNALTSKFEDDWEYLLDDDAKNIFSSIVNIPFKNVWLFFATLVTIDYQMNNLDYSYVTSLTRTIGFLIILICGSSIRYQTLFERDRKDSLNLLIKMRDEVERYILYLNNNGDYIPIASVGLQVINVPEKSIFMVQLDQLNSTFDDYVRDIGNYICQQLIERIKIYGDENRKSVRLIWSIPSCKQRWTFAVKANKFVLINTYKDFSFMPFVNSYVQQYDYYYEWKQSSSEIINDTIQNE